MGRNAQKALFRLDFRGGHPRILVILIAMMTTTAGYASGNRSRSWVVDREEPGSPARIEREFVGTDSSSKVLRSPTFEVTAQPAQKPKTRVVKQLTPKYIPQRLRFNRISIVGNPVEPRVRFQRDPEIFSMGGIKDEKIRGDFFQKVADDLNP